MNSSLKYSHCDSAHNSIAFPFETVLFDEQSQFQRIQILESHEWGQILLLDGEVQSSAVDEVIFNEARAHIPYYSLSKKSAEVRALVIGGGNGATLRELLKHQDVQHVDIVEIDPLVIEACSKYIPSANEGGLVFRSPRVDVRILDGFDFLLNRVSNDDLNYDLIIADCTSPETGRKLSSPIYSEDFFRLVAAALRPDGIFTIPAGAPSLNENKISTVLARLRKSFRKCGFYKAHVPTFGLGYWTAAWATNGTALNEQSFETIQQHYLSNRVETMIYNPNFHFGAVYHDQWLTGIER